MRLLPVRWRSSLLVALVLCGSHALSVPLPRVSALNMEPDGSALSVHWVDAASNRVYVVESSIDLADTNWTVAGPDAQWPVRARVWTNTPPSAVGPVFYRIFAEELLPPPSGMAASISNELVALSWDAVSGASGYRVYWSTNVNLAGMQTQAVSEAAGCVLEAPGAGAVLYYCVTALGTWGESEISAVVNVLPAAPADEGGLTPLVEAMSFLYEGAGASQEGVAEGVMESQRVGVVRGRVVNTAGSPLSGVRVEIGGRPEFGWTFTRSDGLFDMAANGGEVLTFQCTKAGFMSSERQLHVPWQDYVRQPDLVMIPLDPVVSPLDLTSNVMQVARGSAVADTDGPRQATVLVPTGVVAHAVLPDGSAVGLTNLSLRATEYTVGPGGVQAMPAELPPNSGYTYCLDLTVDEADGLGAESVVFDRPLPYYVENFLGFPVGTAVPAGYYDRARDRWIAADDGRVIAVVGLTGGRADIDVDGDGVADTGAALHALNITDEERERLAGIYAVGQELWRVPIRHFTPWDFNWPFGPVEGAEPPRLPLEEMGHPPCESCRQSGSIIEVQGQSLGESLPIVGTPYTLEYHSDRTRGRHDAYVLDIPMTGASVPAPLLGVQLEVRTAGSLYSRSFSAAPNQTHTYIWDGRDAFGRQVNGRQRCRVRVGYRYPGVYQEPGGPSRNFGRFSGIPMTANPAREEAILWQEWEGEVGTWSAESLGLGGWTLNVHHTYDRKGGILYRGDGTERRADALGATVVHYLAGTDGGVAPGTGVTATNVSLREVAGLAVAPNSDLYIAVADSFAGTAGEGFCRLRPDGIIDMPDGLDFVSLGRRRPLDCAFGPLGRLHMAVGINAGDGNSGLIYRQETNGALTVVAGKDYGENTEGGLATNEVLTMSSLAGLAVAADGTIYLSETARHRVRAVYTDGTVSTVAGTGVAGFGGDGGPASAAQFNSPRHLAVLPDGSLLIADVENRRVRRLTPDGRIETVAGNGADPVTLGPVEDFGEGGVATNAPFGRPRGLAAASDGSFYVSGASRVRHVSSADVLSIVTASPLLGPAYPHKGYQAHTVPAARAGVGSGALGLAGDGSLFMETGYYGGIGSPRSIHRVSRSLKSVEVGETAVPCEYGRQIYVFDRRGKHLRTMDAVTGVIVYRFSYLPDGRLSGVTDACGNTATITDTQLGEVWIEGPYGHQTVLALNDDGRLESAIDPAGSSVSMVYSSEGLLEELLDAEGYLHTYTHDPDGRLTADVDPALATQTLRRAMFDGGYEVTHVTGEGYASVYRVESLPDGRQELRNTFPTDAQTLTYVHPDGSSVTTFEDGVTLRVTPHPDPRFGMDAPLIQQVNALPGGAQHTNETLREVDLADPDDPLSVTGYRELLRRSDGFTQPTWQATWSAGPRTWSVGSPGGRNLTSTLDGSNLVRQAEVVDFDVVTFDYDGHGRRTRLAQGDRELGYTYDGLGRLAAVSNALGETTRFAYDAADRLTNAVTPEGNSIALSGDGRGNITNIVPARGYAHGMTWDERNLLAQYRPPENPAYTFTHTRDRMPDEVVYPSADTVDFEYDGAGRVRSMDSPLASVQWSYGDRTDRPLRIQRERDGLTQAAAFAYDGGMVTQVVHSGTATCRWNYAYDNFHRLQQIDFSSGTDTFAVVIDRDPDGLPTSWGVMTFERDDPRGAVTAIEIPPFTRIEYGYDSQGRLATRTHAVMGNPFYELSLTYDAAGRIATRDETVDGTTISCTYAYDADGRLASVERDASEVEGYIYDENGNRYWTDYEGTVSIASFDAQDRIRKMGDFFYGPNDDGFFETRNNYDAGTYLGLTYDRPVDLVSADVDGLPIAYVCDGMGRRVARERDDADLFDQFYYGNPARHFELTASRDTNGVLSLYSYDDYGNLVALQRDGQFYLVGTDQVGTPKVVVDMSGTVVKALDHDSFGRLLSDSAPAFALPIGFGGGLYDPDTGLVRFGLRDYDPMTGRWTARDPILFASGQLNLYAYAGNDPVSLLDRSGLAPESAVDLSIFDHTISSEPPTYHPRHPENDLVAYLLLLARPAGAVRARKPPACTKSADPAGGTAPPAWGALMLPLIVLEETCAEENRKDYLRHVGKDRPTEPASQDQRAHDTLEKIILGGIAFP